MESFFQGEMLHWTALMTWTCLSWHFDDICTEKGKKPFPFWPHECLWCWNPFQAPRFYFIPDFPASHEEIQGAGSQENKNELCFLINHKDSPSLTDSTSSPGAFLGESPHSHGITNLMRKLLGGEITGWICWLIVLQIWWIYSDFELEFHSKRRPSYA